MTATGNQPFQGRRQPSKDCKTVPAVIENDDAAASRDLLVKEGASNSTESYTRFATLVGPPNPIFTQEAIERIRESLESKVDQERLKILPNILRYWASYQLHAYFSWQSPPELAERRPRLRQVAKLASELRNALGVGGKLDRAMIALAMAHAEADDPFDVIWSSDFSERLEKVPFGVEFLECLAKGAERAARNPRRGRPRNNVATLVIQDIAALYEYLTKEEATRIIDTSTGKGRGDFWKFAKAIWDVVFKKGDDGIPAAFKKLVESRQKHGERSPLIYNIDFRYPEWRIFEL